MGFAARQYGAGNVHIYQRERNERRAPRVYFNARNGHTVQSVILGPLFLPVIGLPSLLWAGLPVFRKYRERRSVSYYWLYTERWANFLGERTVKARRENGGKNGKRG